MKHLLDEISVNHYGLCNINIKAAKIDIATVTCICAALHYAITPVLVVRSKNINRIPVAVNIKQHDIARIKKADNILGVIRIRGCSETGTIRINHTVFPAMATSSVYRARQQTANSNTGKHHTLN